MSSTNIKKPVNTGNKEIKNIVEKIFNNIQQEEVNLYEKKKK
jgi:hypothetical protein